MGYSLKDSRHPGVAGMNTSAAEQRHHMSQRVVKQVRFMKGIRAAIYMSFVRLMLNMEINDTLLDPGKGVWRPDGPALPVAPLTLPGDEDYDGLPEDDGADDGTVDGTSDNDTDEAAGDF